MGVGGCRGEHLMIKAAQKATLFQSWDNPFDKRVQSQPNVWRIKVGTSLEGWSGDIVHWGPLQGLSLLNTSINSRERRCVLSELIRAARCSAS
jgi:hypothetical protein|tara:strand:- start:1148 stop:1426 length:279 start_codon:yes stop_codon:yes gene_type:complete